MREYVKPTSVYLPLELQCALTDDPPAQESGGEIDLSGPGSGTVIPGGIPVPEDF